MSERFLMLAHSYYRRTTDDEIKSSRAHGPRLGAVDAATVPGEPRP
jgi:hypothetical protein